MFDCLDQHFLDCHINVTLLRRGAAIASKEEGAEPSLECSEMNTHKGCSRATDKLLTHDKDLQFPVGSTGQGESGYVATRALPPHSSTVAFTGAT